jgi:3-deoxy-7-phosphoheptulonate synthase
MIVILEHDADRAHVRSALQGLGLWTEPFDSQQGGESALFVAPHSASVEPARVIAIAGVRDVKVRPSGHPRLDAQAGESLPIGSTLVGVDARPVLMAGPCSIESEEQIHEAAAVVARAGGRMLRGGAFKPRTSPYSFQGKGRVALGWIRQAADAHGLEVVTEVMSEHEVDPVAEAADLMQIGSRNMQNFALLHAVGRTNKPVLLKRGMSATIDEWLLAAEHLLTSGATAVVLCERGISSFDPRTRNLLDLGAVALVRHVHRLPVIVDPSHATGRRDLVAPLARAALAAGASGLLIESHPQAQAAKSDGAQALAPDELVAMGQACFPKLEPGPPRPARVLHSTVTPTQEAR